MSALLQSLGLAAAKTMFGVSIFAAILLAWMEFGDRFMRHLPLPGQGGPGGSCAVWFVGSSTIYRWSTMTEDMAPWIVANRGVNGATVEDLADRLAVEPMDKIPGTVVFYAGENDIADGATAEQTFGRVKAMVAAVHHRMPVHTVVIGLKPSPTRWSFRAEQLRFNALAADFAQNTPNSTFVDFSNRLLVDGKPGPYYDGGGIHLNRQGYRLWARGMQGALARSVPPVDFARCTARGRSRRSAALAGI